MLKRATKSKKNLEICYDDLYVNLTLICKSKPGLKMEGSIKFEDFQKSRTSVVQCILYSLIFVIDGEGCRRLLTWPPRCGPEAKEFRENVIRFMRDKCKDFRSKATPTVNSAFLTCSNAEKCIKFLTEFSTYVLIYISKNEGVVMLKCPPVWNSTSLNYIKYIEYNFQKKETEELENYQSAVEYAKITATELLKIENKANMKSMKLREEIEEALDELCSLDIKGYSKDTFKNQIITNDNSYFLDMLKDIQKNKQMEIKFSQVISYFEEMIQILKLSNAILYPEDINYGQIRSALSHYFQLSKLDTNMIFTKDGELSLCGMFYGYNIICERVIENKEITKYEKQIKEARIELKRVMDEIQNNTDWYTKGLQIKEYCQESDENELKKKKKPVKFLKQDVDKCRNELTLLNVCHGGMSTNEMAQKIFKIQGEPRGKVYFRNCHFSDDVSMNDLRKGRVPL